MKKNLILIFSLVSLLSFSQNKSDSNYSEIEPSNIRTGSSILLTSEDKQWHSKQIESFNNSRSLNDADTIYQIPIVVHVLHDGVTTEQNVTDAQIDQMVENLNKDFARTNEDAAQTRPLFLNVASSVDIQFVLAQVDPEGYATTGINRVVTDHGTFDPWTETHFPKYTSEGGADSWNTDWYCNIWICDLTGGTGLGPVGYSTLPSYHGMMEDGIVLDYVQIVYDEVSRTITHEMGHYWGLYDLAGEYGADCSIDDGFEDTPNCSNALLGVDCDESNDLNSCDDGPGDLPDQYENFKCYSNCKNMFTIEQATYMKYNLENTRISLLANILYLPPLMTEFAMNVSYAALNEDILFQDLSYSFNGITEWEWNFGDGTTSNLQNPTHAFAEAGFYTIELSLNDNKNTDEIVKTSCLEIYDPSTSIGNPINDKKWIVSTEDNIVLDFSDEKVEDSTVEIYDMLGRKLWSSIVDKTRNKYEISTENFTRGIYIVNVKTATDQKIEKLYLSH